MTSIVVLWTGKLIPRLPGDLLDIVLATHLVLICLLIFVLTQSAWKGDADPFGGWRARYLPIGLAAGLVAFVLVGVAYAISDRILGLDPPREAALVGGVGIRLLVAGGIALLSALLEEWVFRRVLLDGLRLTLSRGAAPISAACFAAYHLSPFQLLPTFLLGLILAGVVLRLRSLWPAIVAHAVFNVLGLALATIVPRG